MPHDIRSELSALQDDLKSGTTSDRSAASHQAEAPRHDKWPDLSRVLQDLQEQLQDTAGSAEDLLAEHPIAAVASAFLLGIVVGRAMGHTK